MSEKNFKRAAGKGYYIALVLCAAAIGITSYVYYRNTNKDVESDWITQEPTSLAWDVQVDALILGGDTTDTGATPITELVVGRTYVLKFSRTLGAAGEKNRDAANDEMTYIGQAILNDFTITAQNGNLSTATAKFTGAADLAPYDEDEE